MRRVSFVKFYLWVEKIYDSRFNKWFASFFPSCLANMHALVKKDFSSLLKNYSFLLYDMPCLIGHIQVAQTTILTV
jgi:hypothetical protein